MENRVRSTGINALDIPQTACFKEIEKSKKILQRGERPFHLEEGKPGKLIKPIANWCF